MTDKFPPGVAEQLKWYVYRLIDPRNGETFYVGKGKGNRIFEHAKGALSEDKEEDPDDLKVQRIIEIQATGLEVAHVIHRHNIESEDVAYQIEATLMDAFPGLLNKAGGRHSGDYGCMHVNEIIRQYAAEPFQAREPLILITITWSFEEEGKSIYDAVRCCWRIDVNRAKKYRLVLGHRRGLVIGAFRPKKWLPGTKAHFPRSDKDRPERWGFVGESAEKEIEELYVNKRVPDKYRVKGAANPIRFIEPEVETIED